MKCVLSAAAKQNRCLWDTGAHEPGPVGGMPYTHITLPLLSGHFGVDQDVAACQRGRKYINEY